MSSVLDQTYPRIEYVVIDGGSTDGTVDVIRAFEEQLSVWISESDEGIYAAMNKGISKATGDYLIFMNAGDAFVDKHVVARFSDHVLRKGEAAILYGDSIEYDCMGNRYLKCCRSHRYVWYGMFAHHQAIFFRRRDIADLLYRQDYVVAGDYAFVAEMLARGARAQMLEFPVCLYLQGGMSTKRTGRAMAFRELRHIKRDILGMKTTSILLIELLQRFLNWLRSASPTVYYAMRGMRQPSRKVPSP